MKTKIIIVADFDDFKAEGRHPSNIPWTPVLNAYMNKSDLDTLELTEDQKNYLNKKYDINNLIYFGRIPGNGPAREFYEACLGKDGGKSKNMNDFLLELKNMGVITLEEYRACCGPSEPAGRPANYHLLSPEEQRGYLDISEIDLHTSDQLWKTLLLRQDVDGMEARKALRIMAFQQNHFASLSLGESGKNLYATQAKIMNRIADLIDSLLA